jgi:hypothetical protein
VYVKAAESFFRPEFFNRLDRILPFQRLSRDELGQIARTIIAGILTRAGLAQRKCAVDVTGDAIEWMVDRGYHPALGARAMRRAVESELVRPVARKLAAILPETPTVVRVFRCREQLVAEVTPLAEAESLPESQRPGQLHDPQEILARCRLACDRIAAACKAWRPAGEISAVNPSPLFSWHLGLMTELAELRESLRTIGNDLRGPRRRGIEPMLQPRRARGRRSLGSDEGGRRILKELYAAQDVIEYIQELGTEFNPPTARDGAPSPAERLMALLDRLALWDAVQPGEQGWQWERVLVLVRGLGNDEELRKALGKHISCEVTFEGGSTDSRPGLEFGLTATRWTPLEMAEPDGVPSRSTSPPPGWLEWIADPDLRAAYQARHYLDAILFEGHRAERLLRLQEGTHLFVCDDGRLWPLQAIVLPLGKNEPPEQRLLDCLAAHDRFQDATARGEPALPADPFAWQPVTVLHPSGWKAPIGFRSYSRRAFVSAMFPLPPELRGQDAAGPEPSGSTPP